jgi:ABC-type sugar transport system ATPase subunit
VLHSQALPPHPTVPENTGFGHAAPRVPAPEADARVRVAAALVEADGLLDRRPDRLSGGERQRVALARAIVREPAAFLLDEPLSNLDAQLRVQMRGEIRRLQRTLGATMLYVTHDQVEALTLGDRIAVLAAGELQQVGDPDELYRRPANRFVGRFLGSPAMNLLPAALEADGLRFGPFVVAPPPLARDGVALEAGVRPEDLLVLGPSQPGDADPSPPEGSHLAGASAVATVDVVEPAGSETFLHVVAGPHRLVVRAGPDVRPATGSSIRLAVRAGRVHVFDAATGERAG